MPYPPGPPVQSMPAGWLKKISWCEEQIKSLQKRVLELERRPIAVAPPFTDEIDIPIVKRDEPEMAVAAVKRGPGRPRKHPIS